MSDVSNKLLKTLTPLALFVASQCSVANAAGTIQIVGPEGKDQTVSSQVVAQSQPARTVTTAVVQERKVSPAKIYGPTKENETLWSIASDINPSNTTSVQQTLLAIYRLNPHAFENNNIHGLEPNSRLRLPTLEQVRRENTDDAKQLLLAHKKKLATQSTSTSKTVEKTPVQVKKETPTSLNKVKPDIVEAKSEKALSKAATPTDVGALKSELETTEQEFSALQENNHQLRVRLAEVQNEVDNLKNSLGDEDRIRNEVEKFINEQKQLAAAEKKTEPSAMDNIASSPGLIALLALIPGALIAGLIGFFLFRRKKEEDESSAENTNTEQPSALIMPDDHFNLDDDIPEISLDDDDDILADLNDDEFLFGNDDSDLNDDLFAEFETENKELDDEDPFALLDGEDNDDLNSMLSDKELDDLDAIDMSSSALTVDSEEKALGLEEMEKALNDFDSDLFSTSDLEEEDDDFDLSLIDDSELSALDKPAPELDDNEDLEGGELDQSMLDDLFSSMDMEDDSELDQGWDLDEKEETKLAPESASKSVEDELDFDTLLSGIEDNKGVEESDKEESIDLDVDEDNVTLLDELLDESDDEDSFDLDIKDDSTALLDDLLDDDAEIDLDIDDDSTALLDELLSDDEELIEDDDDIEIDEDSTALLDEFLLDKDEDEDDTPELDEDSTVLLDELLGDDFEEEEKTLGKSGDDTEVEGVAVSDLLSEDTPRDEDWLVEADDDEDDDIPLFESEAKDEPATEEDDSLFDIDELLESEIAQEETSPELDELEPLEATSLETPEQIDAQD
ncbi:FimV/HubP family polar landmark protein, partial [Aliivibrio sp. 1S175]|uniref:FimV/HubP family polar landmark protein n=3 Tax=unclassified Aliivibrio TaxID=2645654 RepID=UPI000AB498B0